MKNIEFRSATEIQEETAKLKFKTLIDLENLCHLHIMEEIEAMKRAKIKIFERQVNVKVRNPTITPIK
jgi:hypothetical protein